MKEKIKKVLKIFNLESNDLIHTEKEVSKKTVGYEKGRKWYISCREYRKEEHSNEHSKSKSKTNSRENKEVEFKPEAKLQKFESNSEERSKKEENNEEITENNETISNSSSAQQIEMSQYKVPTQIRPPLPSHNRKK